MQQLPRIVRMALFFMLIKLIFIAIAKFSGILSIVRVRAIKKLLFLESAFFLFAFEY